MARGSAQGDLLNPQDHAADCKRPLLDRWGVCDWCGAVVEPSRMPWIPSPEQLDTASFSWGAREEDLPTGRAADRGFSQEQPGAPAEHWEHLDRD